MREWEGPGGLKITFFFPGIFSFAPVRSPVVPCVPGRQRQTDRDREGDTNRDLEEN